MKILMVGLKNGENLGDVIINDSAVFLVKSILEELQYSDYEIETIDMTEEDYQVISTADLIIFTGGGIIKYKYQKFYHYIDEIIQIAEKREIPVIFNAVGVEGYDHSDENCVRLKNAINKSCVKQITVRDDIDLLRSNYIDNNSIYTEKVADSAVWASEVYKVHKKQETHKIGLGVVREGIFRSNGIDIGLEELLVLWRDIIVELEKEKMEWEIFTTGWPSDMKFAINLMKFLGRENEIKDKVRENISSAKELVQVISEYNGIIAGRLHANIVAYSLKISSVGLVWNEKCAFWGMNIRHPERYFRYNEFHGVNIVHECMKAIETGYHEEDRELYKKTSYNSLKRFLVEFINEK